MARPSSHDEGQSKIARPTSAAEDGSVVSPRLRRKRIANTIAPDIRLTVNIAII
jgi:hypothetical protein